MTINVDRFKLNRVHAQDVVGAINGMRKAVIEGQEQIELEINNLPRTATDEDRQAIREEIEAEVYDKVKEYRAYGQEHLPELEQSVKVLKAKARNRKAPQTDAGWTKANQMRESVRRTVERSVDDPDTFMAEYEALGRVGRHVFLEEARAVLTERQEKESKRAYEAGRLPSNSYKRTWKALEQRHYGPLYEVHERNVKALNVLRDELKAPHGAVDKEKHLAEIRRRFGVRDHEADEARKARERLAMIRATGTG